MRFIVLVLVQVLIINNIQISGFIVPYFYILFILGYMVLSMGLFESDFYFLLGAYVIGTFSDGETSPKSSISLSGSTTSRTA